MTRIDKIKAGIKANLHNVVNAPASRKHWFNCVLKTDIAGQRPVQHYINLFAHGKNNPIGK